MEGKSDFSVWVPLGLIFGPSLINLIVLGVAVCLGKAKEYAGKDPLWVLLPVNAHVVCFGIYPMMLYEWLNKIVTHADQRNRVPEPKVQEKPKEPTFEEKYPGIYWATKYLSGIRGLRNKQRSILSGSLFEIDGDDLKYKGTPIKTRYRGVTINGRVEISCSEYRGFSCQMQRHFEVRCGSAYITDDLRLRKIDSFLSGAMTEYLRLEAKCHEMCDRDAEEIVDGLPQRSLYATS